MNQNDLIRLGIDKMNIDADKSYEVFDPSTNNHNIFVHLIKQEKVKCDLCNTLDKHISKGSKKLEIKYSNSLEMNLNIIFYRRQYKCKNCGKYFQEHSPFTDKNKSISAYTEIRILNELKDINATYKSVAYKFNLSITQIQNIFDKRIDIKPLKFSPVICVDEVYNKKLTIKKFCFVIFNPIDKKVIDILPSRQSTDLSTYFSRISASERDNVKYFSCDLHEPYRQIARKWFPDALICADPFHVIKNLSIQFHNVRRRIMRQYLHLKEHNDAYYWFYKNYWRLLTTKRDNLSWKKRKIGRTGQYLSQIEIVKFMLDISEELTRAYDLYHEYLDFNYAATKDSAKERLDNLIEKFKLSNIKEYIQIKKMLESWHDEIINSFNKYNDIRITNGPMERANRDIKTIYRNAYGARNFIRMRNRLMYVMNEGASILLTPKEKTNKQEYHKRGNYKKNK